MSTDWVGDTGAARSQHDTEAERRPVKPMMRPQKASANSTGFTSQLAGLAMDEVIQKATADKTAQLEKEAAGAAGHEEKKDRACADEEPEDDLEALRARRRQQMKDQQAKQIKYAELGHGGYDEIQEDEFLKAVTASPRSVVHFYSRHFERCKIMDMHLGRCARKFLGTRFVKLDSEKAPFFVERLKIKTLPCVCVFVDGVHQGRQVGFDGLGGDEFTTPLLAWRLKEFGGIEEEFGPEDEIR